MIVKLTPPNEPLQAALDYTFVFFLASRSSAPELFCSP